MQTRTHVRAAHVPGRPAPLRSPLALWTPVTNRNGADRKGNRVLSGPLSALPWFDVIWALWKMPFPLLYHGTLCLRGRNVLVEQWASRE